MNDFNPANATILLVDDDRHVLEVLDARLTSSGFNIIKTDNGPAAISILKTKKIDLLISDMKMPGMNGLEVLNSAREIKPGLPVIFLTAYGSIPDAVEAVKAGANDYLIKPFEGRELVSKLKKFLKLHPPISENGNTSVEQDMASTSSPKMRKLYDMIRKVAQSDVNVLILGDSGVGKERVARLIHQLSPRVTQPFIVVDCGSTPAGLLESELFGHIRGAFTHAVQDKKGLIEAADGGTLFLDEIGNISSDMQVRLLRFLEERTIRPIGDVKEKAVNCRVLAATNSSLTEDIKQGSFREDLYYRLRVVTLTVPRLRDRREDIPILAKRFVDSYAAQHNTPPVKLPEETMAYLHAYPWPGNVRELKNAIEAGMVFCRDNQLSPDDMHLSGLPEMTNDEPIETDDSFSLEDNERNAIIRALKQTGGIQKEAAELLGISRRAIHYKIKKYEIDSAGLRNKNH